MNQSQNGSSRQILAELESLLTQGVDPTVDEVEAAHQRAATAIRNANQRLVEAHQLIAAGHRAAAIEIAERPPHVLDEVAMLDSPLMAEWDHWSSHFGMPRLASLRTDLAAQLHSAYTAEKQNEHLLRRHRLLAIGRANLRQRIAVLSQLATADPSNPHWNKALAEYQRHRLEQLAERATQARKFKDLRCLQQILAELRQTRWLAPVSKSQVHSVQKQIDLLQNQEFTNEAIALGEHIQDAYASGDRARLSPLIQRWRQIGPRVDSSAAADVLPQVQRVIDWFDQDLQHQRDADAQNRALGRIDTIKPDADAKQVHSVIREIISTGAEVPAELRETYQQRLQRETNAKRIKTGLITAVIAVALLAIVALAAIFYHQYQSQLAVTQTLGAIEHHFSQGDWDAVAGMLETAPNDDERFDKFRKRLAEKQLAEALRAAEFEETAATLRSEIGEAMEMDQFNRLQTRVTRLSDQAVKEDEFLTARELVRYAASRREDRKSEFIQQTKELYARIRADLRTLPPDDDARPTLTKWNLQLQEHRTNRWIRDESELQKEVAATSDAVADRWDSLRDMADIQRSLASITAGVGDWHRWQSLAASADEKQSPVREKLQAVASRCDDERPLWEAIEQWNEIASRWKLDQVLSANPEQAKRIQSDAAKVRTAKLDDLPAAGDFLAASQVAIPTAARGTRTLESIIAHMKSTKFSEIGALRAATGENGAVRWFYFNPNGNALREQGERLRIQNFVDLETANTRGSIVPLSGVQVPLDFANYRTQYVGGERSLLAPHVQVCQNILSRMMRLDNDTSQWDKAFVTSYDEVVQAKEMDPLVQFFLASSLLQIGSSGSWTLSSAYDEHLKMIEQAGVETDVDWIDPNDNEAAAIRGDAAALLAKLRQTSPVNPSSMLAKMKASLAIDTRYEAIGWLDQSGDQWIVRSGGLPESGTLYVRYDGSGSGKTTVIGQLADGKISIDSDAGEALGVGRPVWIGLTH